MTQPTIRPAAVMLCGHGSRDPEAVSQFLAFARRLKESLPDRDVDSGFLEFARPVIRDGLEALKARGAKRIACLPGMLFAAGHVKNDLPSELNAFAAENPGIEVLFGRELAVDTRLVAASAARIEEAEKTSPRDIPRADTVLLVVGRGTNDPDANSNVAKVGRMLWEGMGFGWGAVAYSGVAHPRVDAALARLVRLGFKRIVIFPYFLFTGILVRRIYAQTDTVAAANPDVEFVKAGYLNDHPLLMECFLDRLREAEDGTGVMNCLLCKYREKIVGFEKAVGEVQAGHHHHVRGIGVDVGAHSHDIGAHSHDAADHAHGHDHGHDHHHHHAPAKKPKS